MKAVALLALLALGGASFAHSCAAQPPFGRARLAAKSLGVPGGNCSGTAVRRYVILTASHCVADGAMAVTIDDKLCQVWKIVHDGRDHALLVIDKACPQKHYSRIRKSWLVAGDSLFVWGSPGAFKGMLRVGMVSGVIQLRADVAAELGAPKGSPSLMFTGAFAKGDSGAGIFDARGRLVGVLSWGSMSLTYPPHLFTGMLPLNFSREQLAEAGL